jgi:hypothetical protein
MNGNNNFSIRNFLKARNALLVHFSSPMTTHDYFFPDDLHNAISLRNIPISFSTIQPNDRGPYDQTISSPEEANAAGCVGIMVDIDDIDCIETVSFLDGGSYTDVITGAFNSGGEEPTQTNCERSIDQRVTYNEWCVKNYRTIGIFVFSPIAVRDKITLCVDGNSFVDVGEKCITIEDVLKHFPSHRIFSANSENFLEYSRALKEWSPIQYERILPVN